MKVFYDHQVFNLQRYGGASKYFLKLIENFSNNVDPTIISLFNKNIYLTKTEKKKTFIQYKRNIPILSQFTKFLNKSFFNYNLKYNKPDIIHYTYFNEKNLYKTDVKKIVTEYDLIKEKFYPEDYFDQIEFKKKLYKDVDQIICISENTKKDLVEYYKIDEKKIITIHLGVDENKNYNEKKIDTKPYILFVGARKRYKNFFNLLKAYSLSNKINEQFNIICFGGGNFSKDEKVLMKDLKISNNNIFYQEGNDFDLNFFYKKARMFIYPSLYEGFGLPILEAMNMSCPVACSKTSSFLEIGRKAVIYFDPNSVESIKDTLEHTLFDDQKIKEIKIKGLENIKNFSWKDCANKTEMIYKKIL